jgi:hypothetical protein
VQVPLKGKLPESDSALRDAELAHQEKLFASAGRDNSAEKVSARARSVCHRDRCSGRSRREGATLLKHSASPVREAKLFSLCRPHLPRFRFSIQGELRQNCIRADVIDGKGNKYPVARSL